jgi:C-terminal processing protease CtpA/Prc
LRSGVHVELTLTPSNYTYKVSSSKVIKDGSKNVGYLRFDSFSATAVSELQGHFRKFKNADVAELVIDLRYNGGGAVSIASILLDHISNAHPSKRQMYDDWNANYKHRNGIYSFEDRDDQDGDELNMKRVFFLVTKDSASASEAVINALMPHLGASNVITVGSRTHGKPVGMSPKVFGSNIYYLVNFILRNNAGNSISFSGIPANCPAPDDITRELGDSSETMLSTALHFIRTGKCG